MVHCGKSYFALQACLKFKEEPEKADTFQVLVHYPEEITPTTEVLQAKAAGLSSNNKCENCDQSVNSQCSQVQGQCKILLV